MDTMKMYNKDSSLARKSTAKFFLIGWKKIAPKKTNSGQISITTHTVCQNKLNTYQLSRKKTESRCSKMRVYMFLFQFMLSLFIFIFSIFSVLSGIIQLLFCLFVCLFEKKRPQGSKMLCHIFKYLLLNLTLSTSLCNRRSLHFWKQLQGNKNKSTTCLCCDTLCLEMPTHLRSARLSD